MVRVIIATDSEIKRKAVESSNIASDATFQFVNVDNIKCIEFDGPRWSQPFTASGGMFAAMQRISAIRENMAGNNNIIIAIESYVTETNKDGVCIVINYYVNGEKKEFVSFSPSDYMAVFPEKYLQHLASIEKYQPGCIGFNMTIGDVIELETHVHGGGVCKNWHKLFNSFDRVEQIRETLNYISDQFKKIVAAVSV